MISFFDMVVKSGLRSDGHTRIWGLVLGGGAFFALAFAVVGVVFGVGFGENTIIAGPEVVVATPDTGDFSSAVGATSIAISRSESGFGRTVWNLATAAILAGIAAFLFGLSRFLEGQPVRAVLFAKQSAIGCVVARIVLPHSDRRHCSGRDGRPDHRGLRARRSRFAR